MTWEAYLVLILPLALRRYPLSITSQLARAYEPNGAGTFDYCVGLSVNRCGIG